MLTTQEDMRGLVDRLRSELGERSVVTDPEALVPHLTDWRRLLEGLTPALVQPDTVEGVSRAVALCNEFGATIVPQGGNTGLAGGATVDRSMRQVVISTNRLNRVREIDRVNQSMTVEAGVVLADVQAAAREEGLLFPLSLGAEGSCHIGGNLATNAGGHGVLRYGNSRELCLGLEVVLPDGRIWRDLKGLRKDNTGYDLKQLFIGSEGTLGIITAAVLRLFPQWQAVETALVGFDSLQQALDFFAVARAESGDLLVAYELMPRVGVDMAVEHVDGCRNPLSGDCPWYVLGQFATSSRRTGDLRELVEHVLQSGLEKEQISDAVLAQGNRQIDEIWALREGLVEAQRLRGASVKHDVSVRISRIAEFIEVATDRIRAYAPDDIVVAFGHVGDGNVHLNICQPAGGDETGFLGRTEALSDIVYDCVTAFDGSISAEHGIGRLKRSHFLQTQDDASTGMMRAVKSLIDPNGVMNPNVLF